MPAVPAVPDAPAPDPAALPLGRVLGSLAAELARMGQAGHDLQAALSVAFGPAAAAAPPSRATLIALQDLDALTQHAEALAVVAGSLSRAAPEAWRLPPEAVGPVPLEALARALHGGGTTPGEPPGPPAPGDEHDHDGVWIDV